MLNLLLFERNKKKTMPKPKPFGTSPANQMSPALTVNVEAYAGIARRAGRSPSEARKLPKRKPRSPRGMVEYGKPLRANPWEWGYTTSPAGSSGGSAEGASEGRQPLTGPLAARRAGGQI